MRTVMHFLRFATGLDQPGSQTTAAERAALRRHAAGRKTIVEIGVSEGLTTRELAEGSDPDATVFGIDPFRGGRIGISWGQKIASRYLSRHIRSGKVRLVRALSTEVDGRVPDRVDFVFVDGDHSPEGIRADWAFWQARLRPGGIMALHDSIHLPGRARLGSHDFYTSEISRDDRFRLLEQVDSLVILQKLEPEPAASAA